MQIFSLFLRVFAFLLTFCAHYIASSALCSAALSGRFFISNENNLIFNREKSGKNRITK